MSVVKLCDRTAYTYRVLTTHTGGDTEQKLLSREAVLALLEHYGDNAPEVTLARLEGKALYRPPYVWGVHDDAQRAIALVVISNEDGAHGR